MLNLNQFLFETSIDAYLSLIVALDPCTRSKLVNSISKMLRLFAVTVFLCGIAFGVWGDGVEEKIMSIENGERFDQQLFLETNYGRKS